MSYELRFEPPETWVWLFQKMLAFTFLPEIISHSTFTAPAATDLCVGRRGTLIKTAAIEIRIITPFPFPLPGFKNEMTLMPLGFYSYRGTKSPNMGLNLNSRQGLPYTGLALFLKPPVGPQPLSMSRSPVQVGREPLLIPLKESTWVYLLFPERGLPFS